MAFAVPIVHKDGTVSQWQSIIVQVCTENGPFALLGSKNVCLISTDCFIVQLLQAASSQGLKVFKLQQWEQLGALTPRLCCCKLPVASQGTKTKYELWTSVFLGYKCNKARLFACGESHLDSFPLFFPVHRDFAMQLWLHKQLIH